MKDKHPKDKHPQAGLNVPAAKLPPEAEGERQPDDFRSTMSWRINRIEAEMVEGFQFIADFPRSVTIFGSTRLPETDEWYQEARKLGAMLAKEDFAVVTGGGPGIMEAGNRGAYEEGGDSVGINIQLPMEQRINPYVNHSDGFHYFFNRKLMLTYSAQAYVYFPGGFGTLDEFFEIATLIQTKKIETHIPVILVGKEFWTPFCDFIEKHIYGKFKAIDKVDMKIYTLVDSAEEAMDVIRKSKPRSEWN
jgi:uncharacterized protein (TIGR00730 family)